MSPEDIDTLRKILGMVVVGAVAILIVWLIDRDRKDNLG